MPSFPRDLLQVPPVGPLAYQIFIVLNVLGAAETATESEAHCMLDRLERKSASRKSYVKGRPKSLPPWRALINYASSPISHAAVESPQMSQFFFRLALLSLLLLFGTSRSAITQTPDFTLDIGKTARAFHVDIAARKLPVRAPTSEHDVFFMEDLLSAAGLENNILIVEAKIDNAFAVMHFDTRDKKPMRVIVYNVNWLVPASDGSRDIIVERHLVLGHEIGHHVCKHTAGASGLPREKELEADRFAGALIRAASTKTSYAQGIELTDLISAGKVVFPLEGSRSHPAREERLAALTDGWENGLPCR